METSEQPSNPQTPGNPESKLSFRRRAWEFWRRNQILILQLPVMVMFLFTIYIVLKSIDPRIGVEGFGSLFGYALNGVRGCLIIFTAIWMKKWMWFDLHDQTELELFVARKNGDPAAHRIVWTDRAEWIVALAFATYWYTR
jgi:exosortase/archaeosortase family protein